MGTHPQKLIDKKETHHSSFLEKLDRYLLLSWFRNLVFVCNAHFVLLLPSAVQGVLKSKKRKTIIAIIYEHPLR